MPKNRASAEDDSHRRMLVEARNYGRLVERARRHDHNIVWVRRRIPLLSVELCHQFLWRGHSAGVVDEIREFGPVHCGLEAHTDPTVVTDVRWDEKAAWVSLDQNGLETLRRFAPNRDPAVTELGHRKDLLPHAERWVPQVITSWASGRSRQTRRSR